MIYIRPAILRSLGRHCGLRKSNGKYVFCVHGLDIGLDLRDGAGDIIESLAVGMEGDEVDLGASGGDCGHELGEPVVRLERRVCRG